MGLWGVMGHRRRDGVSFWWCEGSWGHHCGHLGLRQQGGGWGGALVEAEGCSTGMDPYLGVSVVVTWLLWPSVHALAGIAGRGASQHGRHWGAGMAARCSTGVDPYLGVSCCDVVIVAICTHARWCCWSSGDVAVVVGRWMLTGTFHALHLWNG